ncbi:hypothetical protein WDU94_011543 [Cyamophila willieti]
MDSIRGKFYRTMECRLDDMYCVVETLKTDKEKFKCENVGLTEEVATLTCELDQFRDINKKLCHELDINYQETEQLNLENYQLESILNCKLEEIIKYECVTRDLEMLKSRILFLEQEVQCNERKNCCLEEERVRMEGCLQGKEETVQCLEQQVQHLSSEKCNLEQNIHCLCTEKTNLTKELEDCNLCLGKTLMKIYDTNQCIKQEEKIKQTLNDQICNLKLYVEQVEESLMCEKAKGKHLAEELKCVQLSIEKHTNENLCLQKAIECQIQQLNERDQCLQNIRAKVNKARQEFEDYMRSVEDFKGQIVCQRTIPCMRVSHSARFFNNIKQFQYETYSQEPQFNAVEEVESIVLPVLCDLPAEEPANPFIKTDSNQKYAGSRQRRKCKTAPCDKTTICPTESDKEPTEPVAMSMRRSEISHSGRHQETKIKQQSSHRGKRRHSQQERNRKQTTQDEKRKYVSEMKIKDRGENQRRQSNSTRPRGDSKRPAQRRESARPAQRCASVRPAQRCESKRTQRNEIVEKNRRCNSSRTTQTYESTRPKEKCQNNRDERTNVGEKDQNGNMNTKGQNMNGNQPREPTCKKSDTQLKATCEIGNEEQRDKQGNDMEVELCKKEIDELQVQDESQKQAPVRMRRCCMSSRKLRNSGPRS